MKEAGAETELRAAQPLDDQPYKYYGIWAVDQWSKIGLKVTQRVLPTGPWFQAMRDGNFDVTTEGNCQNVVNPLADVGKYLPHSVSPRTTAISRTRTRSRSTTSCCANSTRRSSAHLREFEKHVLDDQAHAIYLLWWQRIVPYRSYVKGWKIGPSHYVNQDLGTVWLDQ